MSAMPPPPPPQVPPPPGWEPTPRPWSGRNSWGSALGGLALAIAVPVLSVEIPRLIGSQAGSAFGLALLLPLIVVLVLCVVARTRWLGVWMAVGLALWPVIAAGVCIAAITGSHG